MELVKKLQIHLRRPHVSECPKQGTPLACTLFLVHRAPQLAPSHYGWPDPPLPLSLPPSLPYLLSMFFPTHSVLMINEVESLTSPPALSPLLLFHRFLQRLACTESRRSRGSLEGVGVASWMEDRWSPARGWLRGQESHKSIWHVHPGLPA